MGSARWIKRSNNRRSPSDGGRVEREWHVREEVCVCKSETKRRTTRESGVKKRNQPPLYQGEVYVCMCVRVCLCRHVSRDVKEAKKKRKTGRANDVLHHISGTFTKFVELFGILMFFFLSWLTHTSYTSTRLVGLIIHNLHSPHHLVHRTLPFAGFVRPAQSNSLTVQFS